jgi:pyridoxine kinase
MEPACLVIAGFESSGVAGIQSDIKTISNSGVFPVGNLTCIVNIMPDGTHNFIPIDSNVIDDAFSSATFTHNISGVKIGMLGTNETIKTVSKNLEKLKCSNVVLDPVLICKDEVSSKNLKTAKLLKDELFNKAKVVTPNLFEAGVFASEIDNIDSVGNKIVAKTPETESQVIDAGKKILSTGAENVFIKGLKVENKIIDYLISDGNVQKFEREYQKIGKVNGAGCSISSKIAAELCKGLSVKESVANANEFITKAFNLLQKTNTPFSTIK